MEAPPTDLADKPKAHVALTAPRFPDISTGRSNLNAPTAACLYG
jgi:hypothetical protein